MFRSRPFLILLAIVAGIYAVRWERSEAVGKYSRPIAQLLDDRSNPTELGFGGRRARLCKIMAILTEAKVNDHFTAETIVIRAAEDLDMSEEIAQLLADSLDENLITAQANGLLEGDSLAALKLGELPTITKGPFSGETIDFEFAIPIDQAPMLETHFANLILQPTFITRRSGVPYTKESQRKAEYFYRANLISQTGYMQLAANGRK
jgi:hypothetical protein